MVWMRPGWFNLLRSCSDFPNVSYGLEGGGGKGLSPMKAVGAAWNPERHLAWQASQKGSKNHLEAPGGEVWFRKWSKVVV